MEPNIEENFTSHVTRTLDVEKLVPIKRDSCHDLKSMFEEVKQ